MQNGTTDEVKKIVSTLNEAEVPSEDIVGKFHVRFNTLENKLLEMQGELIMLEIKPICDDLVRSSYHYSYCYYYF